MGGTLSVCSRLFFFLLCRSLDGLIDGMFVDNYDVSKLHYEGPGNVPGALGGGYGYDVRMSSASVVVP